MIDKEEIKFMKTFDKRKFISLSLLLTISLVGTIATPIIAM